MTHQLKMEIISLRERVFFESIDIPQDSQLVLRNFHKKCKSAYLQCEIENKENFFYLQNLLREKLQLEQEISVAKEKIEKLEEITGSYGLYYKALVEKKKKS